MTFIEIIIAFVIMFFCVFTAINRICRCIEHCATARAYSKFKEHGVMVKMDDVEAGIIKSNLEKENVKNICNKKI